MSFVSPEIIFKAVPKKYKYGISTTVDYTVDILILLKLFNKAGFDFISFGADLNHCKFNDRSKFEYILQEARKSDLSIHSIHAPFVDAYDIASTDSVHRQEVVRKIIEFMKSSADYEIPLVSIHPHYFFYDSWEECYRRVRESLLEILDGKPAGIDLAAENLPGESSSRIFDKIMTDFDRSQLGFCYDSSHENISGQPFHLLKKYNSRITVSHLSDNNGRFDEHLIPGDGNIDWTRLKTYFDGAPTDEVLFELGTGERLMEPVGDFIMRAASKIREIFGH